ncbi:MAG: hypothetical protein IMZ60_01495 [Actinobacteria bacterium]|nr:hypothetical protein [Actinomycetota bacterium]
MFIVINRLIPNGGLISPIQKSNTIRTPQFTGSYFNYKPIRANRGTNIIIETLILKKSTIYTKMIITKIISVRDDTILNI